MPERKKTTSTKKPVKKAAKKATKKSTDKPKRSYSKSLVKFSPSMKTWGDNEWDYACGKIMPECIRHQTYGPHSPGRMAGLMKKVHMGRELPSRLFTKHTEPKPKGSPREPTAFAKYISENVEKIKKKRTEGESFMAAASRLYKK